MAAASASDGVSPERTSNSSSRWMLAPCEVPGLGASVPARIGTWAAFSWATVCSAYFSLERGGEFRKRLLQVADVFGGKVRTQTRIGSERFAAGSAAHAFKDVQRWNHESVMRCDERSRSPAPERYRQTDAPSRRLPLRWRRGRPAACRCGRQPACRACGRRRSRPSASPD